MVGARGPELVGPCLWTRPREPEFVDPSLRAPSSWYLKAQIRNRWLRGWTRARGLELDPKSVAGLVDPSLWTRACGPELLVPESPDLKSVAGLVDPSSWTRARGSELADPGLAARLFSRIP